jgi:hypothetical protein
MRVIGSTHQEFQIGETVAYNENFLDRHDRSAMNMRGARGKVMALHRLDNGNILADIEWDTPRLPKRINVKNLVGVATSTGG